jgi:PAS domain S-box-containing protein
MSAGVENTRRRKPASVTLVGSEDRTERALVGRVEHAELARAISGVSFPPVIAWDKTGTVRLANQAAAETLGWSLDELVGSRLVDFAGPSDAIEHTIGDVTAGRVVAVHTNRTLRVRGGEDRQVIATSRAIDVDGLRGGITVFVTPTEAGRLGRHPNGRSLDLVPVAIGYTDQNWIIKVVSSEVRDLLDQTPQELTGRSLLDLVDPEDVDELRGTMEAQDGPRSLGRVRFLEPSGDEVEVCVLLAPRPDVGTGMRFALVGRIESYFAQQQDRVKELELRLQRIGAEVRAAGLMDSVITPALQNHPELGQLSARQWEILTRLIEGERVPTIAEKLFISQSTVRNHLSTIFHRFGVHSQAELLERLRQPVVT